MASSSTLALLLFLDLGCCWEDMLQYTKSLLLRCLLDEIHRAAPRCKGGRARNHFLLLAIFTREGARGLGKVVSNVKHVLPAAEIQEQQEGQGG